MGVRCVYGGGCMCARACVRAYCACVCACVYACVHACACAYIVRVPVCAVWREGAARGGTGEETLIDERARPTRRLRMDHTQEALTAPLDTGRTPYYSNIVRI